ncbi:MAG: N-acetyltransferase [Chlorobiaceae bacterium]|jgi:UDP-2-acetamido-3-amino-2,3-dideoxy-glucuronate N-acetyltransferase|nr:N-acetyltransferase [Chlorobiaceae bacterium]
MKNSSYISKVNFHPTADVQSASVGEKTVIWQYSVVLPNAVIGKNCNINCHVFVENDVVIGDDVTIKSGVQIWDGMRIENGVFIGPNATFINDMHPRSKVYLEKYTASTLCEGASIGANVTVLAGVKIGKYSLIGAGSVVTHDVPPYSLCKGNPARHCGYVTRDGTVVHLNLMDKQGRIYQLIDGEPVIVL